MRVKRYLTLNLRGGTVRYMDAPKRQNGTQRAERKSVDHTIRHGIRSMLRSVVKRDDFDLPDLGTLVSLRVELDDAIASAVHNLRGQGWAWADVAGELGMSRQAAWERYSHTARAGVKVVVACERQGCGRPATTVVTDATLDNLETMECGLHASAAKRLERQGIRYATRPAE